MSEIITEENTENGNGNGNGVELEQDFTIGVSGDGVFGATVSK